MLVKERMRLSDRMSPAKAFSSQVVAPSPLAAVLVSFPKLLLHTLKSDDHLMYMRMHSCYVKIRQEMRIRVILNIH